MIEHTKKGMNMQWESVLNSNLLNVIVAVIGWRVVSSLRDKQMVKERQREINASYLINAHRVISGWVHKKNLTKDEKAQIEGVIADMQLLGTNEMNNVLNHFIDSYDKGGDVTKLLDTLVSDLRLELKMDPINSKRKFFRFN